jgi:acyl-CoA synthetase (NDP forming)
MTLARLVFPKSIAFIGGKECAIAIRRCRELAFPGKMFAVHPTREEIEGIRTVKSVNEIPGAVDAAFIAVKREPTVEVVNQLSSKACGGAVIYASGFAETGESALQDKLLAAAGDMPLMGPNCYGFVNGLARAALWPDEHGIKPLDRGIAIISQSGNIACNMTFTRRALPLAAVFTIGNQVSVDMAKMVDFLSADQRITAIGLHIEGLPDVAAFAAACERARQRKKPVVILKTGRSEQGAAVAMSHTSSLAGADNLYDALCIRYGIARVHTITAFVETLKFLHGGALSDARIVSLSCSGGEAALTADMAMGRGVSLPDFNSGTAARVRATLNEYVSVTNPLDYHTFIWNQPEKMEATFGAVLSGGYDVGMLILDSPAPPLDNAAWYVAARAFAKGAAANRARAAVVATLPECVPLDLAQELLAQRVTPLFGLDDALTAFEQAAHVGRTQQRFVAAPMLAPVPLKEGTSRLLPEIEAKSLLATFGLKVPQGQLCRSPDAVKAALAIGFPVTLKVSSDKIAHKSEAGGVILNVNAPDEVAAAADKLARISDTLLVERMVRGAVAELIIGVKRDPQFGLALVVGAGGVMAELLQDTAVLLLPTYREEIETALKSLKAWKLIEGFRGRSGDAAAVIRAVEAVAAFASSYSNRLEELDVNPLLVLPGDAVAVDALIRMRM